MNINSILNERYVGSSNALAKKFGINWLSCARKPFVLKSLITVNNYNVGNINNETFRESNLITTITNSKITGLGCLYGCNNLVSVRNIDISQSISDDTTLSDRARLWSTSATSATIPNTIREYIYQGTINNSSALINSMSSSGFSKAMNLINYESLMSIINCLKDYSGTETSYTINFGNIALSKLTDDEIAIATNKGWTLA